MTLGGITRKKALSFASIAFAIIGLLLAIQAYDTHERGFQGLAVLSLVVAAILLAGAWAAGLPPRDVVDRGDEEDEWSKAFK